jgi:hypothetical protein
VLFELDVYIKAQGIRHVDRVGFNVRVMGELPQDNEVHGTVRAKAARHIIGQKVVRPVFADVISRRRELEAGGRIGVPAVLKFNVAGVIGAVAIHIQKHRHFQGQTEITGAAWVTGFRFRLKYAVLVFNEIWILTIEIS